MGLQCLVSQLSWGFRIFPRRAGWHSRAGQAHTPSSSPYPIPIPVPSPGHLCPSLPSCPHFHPPQSSFSFPFHPSSTHSIPSSSSFSSPSHPLPDTGGKEYWALGLPPPTRHPRVISSPPTHRRPPAPSQCQEGLSSSSSHPHWDQLSVLGMLGMAGPSGCPVQVGGCPVWARHSRPPPSRLAVTQLVPAQPHGEWGWPCKPRRWHVATHSHGTTASPEGNNGIKAPRDPKCFWHTQTLYQVSATFARLL